LDRLTEETQPTGGYTLTYDANGNRTSLALGAVSLDLDYAPDTNRLVRLSGTDPRTGTNISASLDYDASGNLTTLAGLGLLAYNSAGRLTRFGVSFLTLARYRYNAQGQRTRKTTPLGRTIYHYDLAGNLIAETTATGQTLKAYVWADHTPLAQIEANGSPVYLHTDPLTTPRLATNPAGTITWRWNSDAFGAIPPDSDPDGDGTRTTLNLRFPGQYFDSETGLFYNWNRYYDPRLGRYLTSDPIGLAGGLNTYAYVENNPLRYIDPEGLMKLPGDPNGLPPGWTPDPSHQDPNGERWRSPGGNDYLDFHKGRPGMPGWRGKDHWHSSGGKDHLLPGDEIPDPPGSEPACGDDCKQKVATVFMVGGTAYIVYRCIRMLPSLLPPFWATIPPNAAIP
jgi:RHS repeat-associated protein